MAASSEMEEFLKWFVAFRNPKEIWSNHPSFLLDEVIFELLALLTFIHAVRNGGRYVYLWFGTILHGLVVESLSYLLPDIDNFWHAQSMVMLLGKRLPLHIIMTYPVFLYTAGAAVVRMNLRKWAEPFAMGLAVVLIDVPFDIMGIKLLWWTWHDTDPNIYDRHYWVPWTSYYFHATFAFSFSFLFHGSRSLLSSKSGPTRFQADGFLKETLCTLVTGLFAMPLGILQFVPLYHFFHDTQGVHTEVCVLMLLSCYALITWLSDRNPSKEARAKVTGWFDEIGLLLVIHYMFYILLVVFAQPEKIKSTGLHETIGDCNATSPIQTASGLVLEKKTFLCPSDYGEAYFDWHCLPGRKPPRDGLDWYTVCGTPFENHTEYMLVVSAFCCLGLFIFRQMLAGSGKQPSGRPGPVEVKPKHGGKQKRH